MSDKHFEDCTDRCKRIADEIEAYHDGRAYLDGEGDAVITDDPQDDWEHLSLRDWLDDALDIEVTAGIDGEYRGASVCVGFGGPNIYVDTRRECVELYWASTEASWGISRDAAIDLDEIVEEFWGLR